MRCFKFMLTIIGTKAFMHYFSLLIDFSRRDIEAKYRKSQLGMFWMVLTPLLLLGVYTLAFSVILGVHKLSGAYSDPLDYVLILFAGLAIFFFFSEVISTSPDLISRKANFVKKVIFPLSILVSSNVISAAFTLVINITLLLGFILLKNGMLPLTTLLLPLIIIPIFLFVLGMAFGIAAIGVYLPDISQIMNPLTRMLFYLTPIVYPMEIIPEAYRSFFWLNPMTSMVYHLKTILIQGQSPNWIALGFFYIAAVVMFVVGYGLFKKLKNGFADVV
jgi:lipopolysaccharide transport system permease protein